MLPWCWTEEAAPWISQQLGLLVFHIAFMVLGIAVFWCWQCLMTVGVNLLPHIVTPLVVTTVAWCCRQNQDVLHPAECPPATLQTSKWQWQHVSSFLDNNLEVPAVFLLKISVLSFWVGCGWIRLHHCFPQCHPAGNWCYLNWTK